MYEMFIYVYINVKRAGYTLKILAICNNRHFFFLRINPFSAGGGGEGHNISDREIHPLKVHPFPLRSNLYSRLSLSRIPKDSLKYFEISVPRHIRVAELR